VHFICFEQVALMYIMILYVVYIIVSELFIR